MSEGSVSPGVYRNRTDASVLDERLLSKRRMVERTVGMKYGRKSERSNSSSFESVDLNRWGASVLRNNCNHHARKRVRTTTRDLEDIDIFAVFLYSKMLRSRPLPDWRTSPVWKLLLLGRASSKIVL